MTSIAALAMVLDDHRHIAEMEGMIKTIREELKDNITRFRHSNFTFCVGLAIWDKVRSLKTTSKALYQCNWESNIFRVSENSARLDNMAREIRELKNDMAREIGENHFINATERTKFSGFLWTAPDLTTWPTRWESWRTTWPGFVSQTFTFCVGITTRLVAITFKHTF